MMHPRRTLAIVLLLSLTGWPSANALEIHEMQPSGQVAIITTADINDERVGLVLVIDRGVNELPRSFLGVFPGPDSAGWRIIDLPNGPGALAAGDVTGNGNDEIAIAYQFEGDSCPSELLGQAPCGVVRIFDGPSLLEGEPEQLARVNITPQPAGCSPTNHPPTSLSLADVTGDGRADLSIGQLGLLAGSCGVVHVISGDRLQGETNLGAACARIEGDVVRDDYPPDYFGVKSLLYTDPSGDGSLAVTAPFTGTDQYDASGSVTTYDVTTTCPRTGLVPGVPPVTAQRHGDVDKHQVGVDLGYVGDLLWVAASGGVLALEPDTLDDVHRIGTPRPIPLSDAGDVTGDGQSEVMVGPWVMTTDGQVVMALNSFSEDNFRGAVVSSDHILASDQFGARLWSLTDLWTPYITLEADPKEVRTGESVRVTLADLIALRPSSDAPEWHVSGGKVIDKGDDWIDIQADSPGTIVAQLKLAGSSALVRVPVQTDDASASLTGPTTVPTGTPFSLQVEAPEDASVSWRAPEATPPEGSGRSIEAQYDNAGTYTLTADVIFAGGQEASLAAEMTVVDGALEMLAPESVPQGERLELSIDDPDPSLDYEWHVEGDRMGPLRAVGTSVGMPAAGWGPVQVTAVARDAAGHAVATGQTIVIVENLPPEIKSFTVNTGYGVSGFDARVFTNDPGGDPVNVTWELDGEPAGEGHDLSAPHQRAGRVVLAVIATDDQGMAARMSQTIDVVGGWQWTDPDDVDDVAGDIQGDLGSSGEGGGPRESQFLPGAGAAPLLLLVAAVAAARRRWQE